MTNYTKILFALDLLPQDDNPVGSRVKTLAKAMGAQLSLVHVVEQLSYSYGEPFVSANYLEWQSELEGNAQNSLWEIGKHLDVPEERQHLEVGRPQDKILEVAKNIGADLIIVGSHGRHGLQKLVLGSTANAVLQSATCDVLAVRVND
jgi:universal stress protein A